MKVKCQYCGNYDFPVEVQKLQGNVECYCSRCGELVMTRKAKKKGFYRKLEQREQS